MTRDPLTQLSTRATPQSRSADPRQVKNNAGGFTFQVTPWVRLDRFLTLGVDGGSYYVQARELALDNLAPIRDLITLDGREVIRRVVEVSQAGRAPRQQPGLFVLAAVYGLGDVDARRAAERALPLVARTGSTLKTFVRYAEQFRGWGPVLRRGVANWYLDRDVKSLAYQAVKYRTRADWSDRDVLRSAHPKPAKDDVARRALFDWMCGRKNLATEEELAEGFLLTSNDELKIVEGFERVQLAAPRDYARIVADYRLPWEALPDAAKTRPDVWDALVAGDLLPPTTLLRQLPTLTRHDVLTGDTLQFVVNRLTNAERLKNGRVHPISVLFAMRSYTSGRALKGGTTWRPIRRIVDALDEAFYAAFGAIEPTGSRLLLALDVSGSMSANRIADSNVTAREASAAMALATLNVEDNCEVVGFTSGRGAAGRWNSGENVVTPLTISPRQRLDDVVRYTSGLSFGGTDCALPMLYALDNDLKVDTFVIYTDNETWAGDVHAHEALRRYRERSGIPARLVAVGMTATRYTVADPDDAGQIDVSGFDAAVPNLIANFARGEL